MAVLAEFSDLECIILLLIFLFVGVVIWRLLRGSGGNGGPRWSE